MAIINTAQITKRTRIAGTGAYNGQFQQPGTAPIPSLLQEFDCPANSDRICTDVLGNFYASPIWNYVEAFDFLPATAAAAGAAYYLVASSAGGGSNAVISRATKGGVNIKTKPNTPATSDLVSLTAVANSGQIVPITANSQPKFRSRVNLTQTFDATVNTQVTGVTIASGGSGYVVGDVLTTAGGTTIAGTNATVKVTQVGVGQALGPNTGTGQPLQGVILAVQIVNEGEYSVSPATPNTPTGGTGTGASLNLTFGSSGGFYASVGMDQNTENLPPNTGAIDSVKFLYDPFLTFPGILTGGTYNNIPESSNQNWILCQNVNGTVRYIDSGVTVVAGVDYDLYITWDVNLIPHFFVGGTEVGAGNFIANTASALLGPTIGEKILASSGTITQIDMDVAYVSVERFRG